MSKFVGVYTSIVTLNESRVLQKDKLQKSVEFVYNEARK